MQTLKIIPKYSSFYVDDFIEGQVELSSQAQIIINDINIVLNISEFWTTYSKELNLNINENTTQPILVQNLNVKEKLNINTNLVALKPGKFTFSFKFKSPKILEPSFEFPGKADKAYIRYLLVTENNIHKWGMFDGGKTKLKVTSINGTDNFRFGEDIKFDIDIDNTNGKLNTSECKIVLKRNVKFKNRYGQLKQDILDELSSRKIKTEATPGEHKNFSYVLSLNKIENKNFVISGSNIPYTNFPDINFFLPSIKTVLLECSYTIKFTLYFNKFVKFNERPRIILNAIMCHQSLDEGKAEMNQKINLSKKNTMPIMQNNILPPQNMVPPYMAPPPMMQPPNLMPPDPNANMNFKKSVSAPINYGNPQQQFNNMMNNNNMNNIQDEELPSMEEIEQGNNINNNFNNSESFPPLNENNYN